MTLGKYTSPRWSGEISDCSMPMTFDQYSNCGFTCIYCFATYQRGIGKAARVEEHLRKETVKAVDVEHIKQMFLLKKETQFSEYIRQRKTMQWGGMSDPFCRFERVYGVGLELLKFFREIEYPICFSTKADWWLKDERYTSLFKDAKFWNCKFSIITGDAEVAKEVEVGVPSPQRRLEAIRKYAELNAGGATLRLRPFIIGISNPGHIELIHEAGKLGATALSTEFFCLELRSPILREWMPIFNRLCKFNLMDFYKKNTEKASGYLRLNREVKRVFVNEMEQACRDVGMRFYVSDAHFKERCDNGSCCGLDESWNYSRGQFTEALLICKRNGRVTWDEIAPHIDFLKGFKWNRATGFNTANAEKWASFSSHTMFDYMRWMWNNPTSGQNPYRMFEKIMIPKETDANGNLIYYYNERKM